MSASPPLAPQSERGVYVSVGLRSGFVPAGTSALPWTDPLIAPAALGAEAWRGLLAGAAEPNGFLDPDYLGPLFTALGEQRPAVLAPRDETGVKALLPVTWALRAHGLPIPALVAPEPYLPLGTPLIAATDPVGAVAALLKEARMAGALALVLRKVPVDGVFARALEANAEAAGLVIRSQGAHKRAALACVGDAETYLRESLGGKKLKEYRRLAKRLGDEGAVETVIAGTPETAAPLLEDFLALEAAGWKGTQGTGLGQTEAHAAFIRSAVPAMAARGRCEVIALRVAGRTIAAGIVLYHGDTALFFKIAYDEAMARFSPGVQLTLDLTRHLFARPDIAFADSTADAHHPMIDHIWRERLAVADYAVATRRSAVAGITVAAALGRDTLRARAKAAILRFSPAHRRHTETPA